MIKFLFLDLDDTILDFHKAEKKALSRTLAKFGLEPTDKVCSRYSQINRAHWERLERKELTRQQVITDRFTALFREYGKTVDAEACADTYAEYLGIGHYFLPGAREAVESLSKKYRLFLASNGTVSVQSGRLKSADICHLFEGVFFSQTMGADKPDILFFQNAFSQIPDFDPTQCLIAGDSLTSDIQGGINAGICTCWVNVRNAPKRPDIVPDYEIASLTELEALLETI